MYRPCTFECVRGRPSVRDAAERDIGCSTPVRIARAEHERIAVLRQLSSANCVRNASVFFEISLRLLTENCTDDERLHPPADHDDHFADAGRCCVTTHATTVGQWPVSSSARQNGSCCVCAAAFFIIATAARRVQHFGAKRAERCVVQARYR